jgi:hypothetical protein
LSISRQLVKMISGLAGSAFEEDDRSGFILRLYPVFSEPCRDKVVLAKDNVSAKCQVPVPERTFLPMSDIEPAIDMPRTEEA